jgi:lipopolysaccharide/colanic/teichoic acid biosynthesis glycosyltransferase
MLIDISAFNQIYEIEDTTHTIASILFSTTREIDLKGWYKRDAIMGVLFVEIQKTSDSILSASQEILHKISAQLSDALTPYRADRIKISCHVFPESDNGHNQNIPPDQTLYPDLIPENRSSKAISQFIKRVIDVLGSSCALVLLSPLLIVIALSIKISSKGPILFKQKRIGQFGKPFTFLKFKSMYINSDSTLHRDYVLRLITGEGDSGSRKGENGGERIFKIRDDPRITPLGKFLRKSSLDELPQLFNVLCGEMSLVGPRPPIPYECDHYDIWHLRRLLEAKPGITGLWQIKGRSRTTFDEMVRLDLKYAEEWSLWLDIGILLQTPWAVFSGIGAY